MRLAGISKAVGELDEVEVAFEVHAAVAVVEEQLLPLAHHSQVVVIDDQNLHRQLMDLRRGQFNIVIWKPPSPEMLQQGNVWVGKLSADGTG